MNESPHRMFIEDHDKGIQKISVSPCAVRTLGVGIISEKHLSASAQTFIKVAKKTITNLLEEHQKEEPASKN